MKISLITITWNNLDALRRTLDSALQQNYQDVEFIVVDGCSTDGTLDYLRQYIGRVMILQSEAMGIYNALNVGIRHATGDVVGLLNAGDTFTEFDILQLVSDAFKMVDDLDFLFGDVHYEHELSHKVSRYYSGRGCSLKTMLRGYAPPHPSLYVKRSIFEKVGLYDESFAIAGDFDFFLRLFLDPKIKHVYLSLDMVTMSPGGISSLWRNRLYTNNVERIRSLRKNRVKSCRAKIFVHYFYNLKSLICRKKRNP
jgi:glycosyltransferase involved in cell wall biosynthesis